MRPRLVSLVMVAFVVGCGGDDAPAAGGAGAGNGGAAAGASGSSGAGTGGKGGGAGGTGNGGASGAGTSGGGGTAGADAAGANGAGSGGVAGSGGAAVGGTSGSGGAAGMAGAGGKGGGAGASGTGGSAGATVCDTTGYTAVAGDALIDGQGNVKYLAQSTLGVPVDVLTFELVAPVKAGTYAIADENYKTCTRCITLYKACDGALANCQKTFLARAGTLTITTVGAKGTTFSGTLAGVELGEVTIAPDNTSTKVPNGATWCVPKLQFSAKLQ